MDELCPGDVLTAREVFFEDTRPADVHPRGSLRAVAVTTCGTPVFEPKRRSALAARGCHACETKARGVLTATVGVLGDCALFGVVKVVSDQVGGR